MNERDLNTTYVYDRPTPKNDARTELRKLRQTLTKAAQHTPQLSQEKTNK